MATLAPDPRDVVTPEAFRVADHLIGVPLARPARRLGAILIDLLLVAILVALKSAWAFAIAVVGAYLVFRVSRSRKEGRWYKRFYRHGLGCFGALLTFILLIVAGDTVSGWFGRDDDGDEPDRTTITTDSGTVAIEGLGVLASAAVLRDGYELRNATRDGQRDTLADAIVARLVEAGLTPEQMRSSMTELGEDEVLPPAALLAFAAAVETTTARLENRPPRSAEEIRIADSTAAAVDSARLAAADTLTPGDSTQLAIADSVRQLREELASTREQLAREEERRAEAEERLENGAVRWILSSVSDELGLGLGWLGLYFTAFTVLGGGQTPGKRVFRLRVIRLDGRPIGWWTALQRFGGYSASVFTGMLGFAEMLWDDNRQALQDKLVATVVVQEPKKGEQTATRALDAVADDASTGNDAQAALDDAAGRDAQPALDDAAARNARPAPDAATGPGAPPPPSGSGTVQSSDDGADDASAAHDGPGRTG